jgi:hypothetical protein
MDKKSVKSEFDIRQFELMLELIDGYGISRLGLGDLFSNLEALRRALENPAAKFIQSFEQLWGNLEVVHAMMLDQARQHTNDTDDRIILNTIPRLKELIRSEIEQKN